MFVCVFMIEVLFYIDYLVIIEWGGGVNLGNKYDIIYIIMYYIVKI